MQGAPGGGRDGGELGVVDVLEIVDQRGEHEQRDHYEQREQPELLVALAERVAQRLQARRVPRQSTRAFSIYIYLYITHTHTHTHILVHKLRAEA